MREIMSNDRIIKDVAGLPNVDGAVTDPSAAEILGMPVSNEQKFRRFEIGQSFRDAAEMIRERLTGERVIFDENAERTKLNQALLDQEAEFGRRIVLTRPALKWHHEEWKNFVEKDPKSINDLHTSIDKIKGIDSDQKAVLRRKAERDIEKYIDDTMRADYRKTLEVKADKMLDTINEFTGAFGYVYARGGEAYDRHMLWYEAKSTWQTYLAQQVDITKGEKPVTEVFHADADKEADTLVRFLLLAENYDAIENGVTVTKSARVIDVLAVLTDSSNVSIANAIDSSPVGSEFTKLLAKHAAQFFLERPMLSTNIDEHKRLILEYVNLTEVDEISAFKKVNPGIGKLIAWAQSNPTPALAYEPLLTYSIKSHDYVPYLIRPEILEILQDTRGEKRNPVLIETVVNSAPQTIELIKTPRGRFTDLMGKTWKELATYTDEQITEIYKKGEFPTYPVMMGKTLAAGKFVDTLIGAISGTKDKRLVTPDVNLLFETAEGLGHKMQATISVAEEIEMRLYYYEIAAMIETELFKRGTVFTDAVALELLEAMRHEFDAAGRAVFEQYAANIEIGKKAENYTPQEKIRHVFMGTAGVDNIVYKEIRENDPDDADELIAELKNKIPGIGLDHEGMSMVFKAYLGCRDPLSMGEDAREYIYGTFDIFKTGVEHEDGVVRPIEFGDLLKFIGVKIEGSLNKDPLTGEERDTRHYKMLGKRNSKSWIEYRAAINSYDQALEKRKAQDFSATPNKTAKDTLGLDIKVYAALVQWANAGQNAVETFRVNELAGKLLPKVRDMTDLLKPIEACSFNFTKYIHPTLLWGREALEEVELEAKQKKPINPSGRRAGSLHQEKDYRWGTMRNLARMAKFDCSLSNGPYALFPDISETLSDKNELKMLGFLGSEGRGYKILNLPNGKKEILLRAATKSEIEPGLDIRINSVLSEHGLPKMTDAALRGWVSLRGIKEGNVDRYLILRAQNIARGNGDFQEMSRFPFKLTDTAQTLLHSPELGYFNWGRVIETCRRNAIERLKVPGRPFDENNPRNKKRIKKVMKTLWKRYDYASQIPTPDDMLEIINALVHSNYLSEKDGEDWKYLFGCTIEYGAPTGELSDAKGGLVPAFRTSTARLGIGNKQNRAAEKAESDESQAGFLKLVEKTHQQFAWIPGSGFIPDAAKRATPRDIETMSSMGAVGAVLTGGAYLASSWFTHGAYNHLIAGVGFSITVGIPILIGRFKSDSISVWTGLGETFKYIGYVVPGFAHLEDGYIQHARRIEAFVGGFARWDCLVPDITKSVPKVMTERFKAILDQYNKTHNTSYAVGKK